MKKIIWIGRSIHVNKIVTVLIFGPLNFVYSLFERKKKENIKRFDPSQD